MWLLLAAAGTGYLARCWQNSLTTKPALSDYCQNSRITECSKSTPSSLKGETFHDCSSESGISTNKRLIYNASYNALINSKRGDCVGVEESFLVERKSSLPPQNKAIKNGDIHAVGQKGNITRFLPTNVGSIANDRIRKNQCENICAQSKNEPSRASGNRCFEQVSLAKLLEKECFLSRQQSGISSSFAQHNKNHDAIAKSTTKRESDLDVINGGLTDYSNLSPDSMNSSQTRNIEQSIKPKGLGSDSGSSPKDLVLGFQESSYCYNRGTKKKCRIKALKKAKNYPKSQRWGGRRVFRKKSWASSKQVLLVESCLKACVFDGNDLKPSGFGYGINASHLKDAMPSSHLLRTPDAEKVGSTSEGGFPFHFWVGVGATIMLMTSRNGINKLCEQLEEMKKLVHELRREFDSNRLDRLHMPRLSDKASPEEPHLCPQSKDCHTEIRVLVESFVGENHNSCGSVLTEENDPENNMAKLEAELEAELQRMEFSSHSGKFRDPLHKPSFDKSEHPANFADSDSIGAPLNSYAVSPLELERRLWNIVEQRQRELEHTLWTTEEKLIEKERELVGWKERVRCLTDISAGYSTGDSSLADGAGDSEILCEELLSRFEDSFVKKENKPSRVWEIHGHYEQPTMVKSSHTGSASSAVTRGVSCDVSLNQSSCLVGAKKPWQTEHSESGLRAGQESLCNLKGGSLTLVEKMRRWDNSFQVGV